MIHPLYELAHELTEGAKQNPPAFQANADQIQANVRSTFERHGIAVTGALGCIVLEMVQNLTQTVIFEAMRDPKKDSLETVVETLGTVAEWAARLIESDKVETEDGHVFVLPAYVVKACSRHSN